MHLALLLFALCGFAGCWRPSAYEPPPAPVPELPDAAGGEGEGVAAGVAEGAEAVEAPVEVEPLQPEEPPLQPFRVRTVQGPVSLVDDVGALVTVIAATGAELEVRAIDPIRARVRCAACGPENEGWIQLHLIERLDGAPVVAPE